MAKAINQPKRANLVQEYDAQRETYSVLCATVADLIKRLLDNKNIKVHTISSRCKDRDSFERKIGKKNKYRNLSDITDIAGVRIITNYSDEVDLAAAVIEKEFNVDRSNTIDKRIAIDPDRFGYLSLHYVVSLKPSRLKLIEYSGFNNLKLEIQIRSILQHTWAEIEHDIGYKSEVEVPAQIKRKFSRLAGLLELADQEFIAIRREQEKYVKMLSQNISRNQKHIGVDKESLAAFIRGNPVCNRLDHEICEIFGYSLFDSGEDNSKVIERLSTFGIKTIHQLERKISSLKDEIIRFAKAMRVLTATEPEVTSNGSDKFNTGICIFYLIHVLVAQSKDLELIDLYLVENSWDKDPDTEEFVDLLMNF